MAARFLVGSGSRTWDGTSTSIWAATSGGASGASAPTSADDVTIDANSGTGTLTTATGAACNNLTITWTAAKTNILSLGVNFAPAGAISINGNSVINRILVQSNLIGTQRTFTAGAAPTLSNVDFQDIATAGAGGTWSGTSIGDCGGNSGITMTPAATQTATGTASFTWSTHGWTSRVPLPQDDVVIPNAFIAGRVITADMPRLGKNVTFSCTGSPAFTPTVSMSMYGSLALASGMTCAANQPMNLNGRSNHTLTCAGCNFVMPTFVQGPGSTYTCQDAWSSSSTNSFALQTLGTAIFKANGFTLTLASTTGESCRVNGGTLDITNTTVVVGAGVSKWNYITGTLVTTGSTIKFIDTSATVKVFAGGGKTYNNLWFSGSSAGAYQLTGANTFADFKADANSIIQFTAATTTTAATWPIAPGSSIDSITAAQHTLAKTGGGKVKLQGVTVAHSIASPTLTFYAFNGSADGGNNTNWQFYNPDYSLAVAAAAFTFAASSQRLLRGLRVKPITTAFAMTRYAPRVIKAWRVNVGAAAFTFAASSVTVREVVANSHYIVRGGARRRSINATRTRTVS